MNPRLDLLRLGFRRQRLFLSSHGGISGDGYVGNNPYARRNINAGTGGKVNLGLEGYDGANVIAGNQANNGGDINQRSQGNGGEIAVVHGGAYFEQVIQKYYFIQVNQQVNQHLTQRVAVSAASTSQSTQQSLSITSQSLRRSSSMNGASASRSYHSTADRLSLQEPVKLTKVDRFSSSTRQPHSSSHVSTQKSLSITSQSLRRSSSMDGASASRSYHSTAERLSLQEPAKLTKVDRFSSSTRQPHSSSHVKMTQAAISAASTSQGTQQSLSITSHIPQQSSSMNGASADWYDHSMDSSLLQLFDYVFSV